MPIEVYDLALQLNPGDGELLNNLGMAHSMNGEPALAIIYFRQAVQNGSATPRTLNNLGMALAREGKDREALQAFAAASDEATAHNNLGYFYLRKGEYSKAIPLFETGHRTFARVLRPCEREPEAGQNVGRPGRGQSGHAIERAGKHMNMKAIYAPAFWRP
jgi:Tfp pilus assembly protein PilF